MRQARARNPHHGRAREGTTTSMPKRLHWISQVSIAIFLCALLAGCSGSGTSSSKSTTPKGLLQEFSGWRAAYLGPDGRLHAVSFDGKSDIAGPSLPHLGGNAYLNFASAGISPAGSVLAYGADGLDMLDLAASPGATRNENTFVAKLSWSQDGSMLAIGDNTGGFWTIKTASGHATAVPGAPEPRSDGPGQLIGWIDANHLAVTDILENTPTVTYPNGESYSTAAGPSPRSTLLRATCVQSPRSIRPALASPGTPSRPTGAASSSGTRTSATIPTRRW